MKYIKQAWKQDKIDFIITAIVLLFFVFYAIPTFVTKVVTNSNKTRSVNEKDI